MPIEQSTLIVLRHAAEIDAVTNEITKVRPRILLAVLDEVDALRAATHRDALAEAWAQGGAAMRRVVQSTLRTGGPSEERNPYLTPEAGK